ncbi:restriction endonuclease [uncultured Dysosmobacter sp.]|uniref:restriction endonuclease n=1 Tax=uncultured Dysosmobacter sp. TaxID=2591384 RepID=UPI00260B052F|nr:restriction endonuclease [uncultured Dysosmobacter sp.]
MGIPKYNEMYLPLLRALGDRAVHTNREMADTIAESLGITQQERQQLTLTSGVSVFSNRVNWACTYLKKAGLVESERRGHHRLTDEGYQILQNPPPLLDNNFLCKYPSFQAFYLTESSSSERISNPTESDETPQDLIDHAFSSLNQKLADDLMAEIMSKDPVFFEQLVVKLLQKMGYGGSASDSGFVTQQSNDGGIDGIIREDKLGFDQIYIQAKRWDPEKSISRPDIQKFSGALRDEGASKGLFITTAKFSDGARASAERQHIVLVDGKRLTRLMIEYDLGVSPIAKYEIKTIDSDFFNDAEE